MIVVVGSRHDPVAAALVEAWEGAALCSAEDLTRPGWAWSSTAPASSRWVVDGAVVEDRLVTGVFVRRSRVYADELSSTHPDDRAYLAAESHAFLVFVLATTRATVVSQAADGTLGDEGLGPERWMPAATGLGMQVAPLRLASRRVAARRLTTSVVEVVADQAFGDVPARSAARAVALVEALGLRWAAVVFDGRHRVVAVTGARSPGAEATAALARLLTAPSPLRS